MLTAYIFCTITTIVIVYLFNKYGRLYKLSKQFKGPPSLPIIGHAHHFMNIKPEVFLQKMEQYQALCGKTIKLWIGPTLLLLLGELKDVEQVLGTTKFNDKSDEYKSMDPWLKEGLLVSRGEKWFKRRKIITPAFHFKILDNFIECFNKQGQIMVRNLSNIDPNQEVELYHYINLCTLDVICESGMGISVNAQTSVDSDYVNAVKTISTVLHKRMFDIIYRLDFTYQFTELAKKEKEAIKVLHGFSDKIIVARRNELLKVRNKNVPKVDSDIGEKKKMAFLDILLQSEIDGKPLSNSDIREEVDTFVFEGHDTTSSGIMFFFYNIAKYREVQRKCYQEIFEILGSDKDGPITNEHLTKLNYIELCIKETLRLYPSVPFLGRRVNKECKLNEKIIPAGTSIGISPLQLGRDADLFPNPDLFTPERFDFSDAPNKVNPFAFIPFSAGPRNCIGQKFAMLEIKSIVVNVLRNFEIEFCGDTSEEPILVSELILRPRDPLMFKLKPRTV